MKENSLIFSEELTVGESEKELVGHVATCAGNSDSFDVLTHSIISLGFFPEGSRRD